MKRRPRKKPVEVGIAQVSTGAVFTEQKRADQMRCREKKQYYSKEEAEKAIENIPNSNFTLRPWYTYQCDGCGHWHLSRMSPEKYKEIRKKRLKAKQFRIKNEAEYWEKKIGGK